MLKTYIPPALITELKEVFPDALPNVNDFFKDRITLDQIAFLSGIQSAISYLEEQAALQKEASQNEEIKII